jgi:hypothetical protein
VHGLRLEVALVRAWRTTEVVRVRKGNDKVAIAVIWLVVVIGALLIGVGSSDPGGVGEVAAGVGIVLTVAYSRLRRARSFEEFEDLIPQRHGPAGAATAAWIRTVVLFLLWIAGSVIFIVLGLRDGYALILGALFPLAAYLLFRRLRSAGHA